MTRVFGGACDAPGCPARWRRAVAKPNRNPPHIQWLRSPPDMKSASASVITTRSNRALSRLKSTTATKNTASTRIRVALVIVVINSSLRSKHDSESSFSRQHSTPALSLTQELHSPFARVHFEFYRIFFETRSTNSSNLESKSLRIG